MRPARPDRHRAAGRVRVPSDRYKPIWSRRAAFGMTQLVAPSARLSETLRLTALLTEQVVATQTLRRPVPDEQVRALANAALILEEYAVPLPPLLMQALDEIGSEGCGVGCEDDLPENEADQDQSKRLAWMLRPFQGA